MNDYDPVRRMIAHAYGLSAEKLALMNDDNPILDVTDVLGTKYVLTFLLLSSRKNHLLFVSRSRGNSYGRAALLYQHSE